MVSWFSRKQPTITQSSIESKFRSMISMAAELNLFTSLLSKLGIQVKLPSATHFAKNSAFQTKMNHVALITNYESCIFLTHFS